MEHDLVGAHEPGVGRPFARPRERDVVHLPGANHYLHMIEHFEACVRDPTRPLAPAEDGADNVAVCAAIAIAARTGSTVPVIPA